MKTRRSILSLIFGVAAAPAAIAVAKAMPEMPEVVGAIRRVHGSQLSGRTLAAPLGRVQRFYFNVDRIRDTNVLLRIDDYAGLPLYKGVPIRVVDEITND